MDPVVGGIVKAGLGLLGGLFGKKKAKAPGVDYVKLRNDAQAAGFNPLTALMAGGGAGYQREFSPDLASGAFISDALSRGVDTYFDLKNQADAETVRVRELAEQREHERQMQAMRYGNQSFGYGLTRTVTASPVTVTGPGSEAAVDPFEDSQRLIQVYSPSGRLVSIRKGAADRLGIKAGGQLLSGDDEEILGEVAGNVVSGPTSPFVLSHVFPGPVRPKKRPVRSDWGVWGNIDWNAF